MRKIESTKKIHIGTMLRVYKKGFGYSKLQIIEVNDYFLCALTDAEFLRSTKDGDKIETYLWVEGIASYEFDLEIIGRIALKHKIIFFDHTDHILKSEERKCLKAKVKIPFKFFIFEPGRISRSISRNRVQFNYGTIIELDDRSAVIECNDDLTDNAFYKGHIMINREDFELVGRVNSKKRKKSRFYDVSFTGMSEKDRNILLDYIFSIYRE